MRSSLLYCFIGLLCTLSYVSATALAPTPNSVVIHTDGTMSVDGKPFKVKGIAYSLVPTEESERYGIDGDYFTPDFAFMWMRDFPRLKAMGVNTLRIYSWNPTIDHTPFLDVCHQFGLKVFITHSIGFSKDNHVLTDEQRQSIIDRFVAQVRLHKDHPAILMWSFGNELNGYWLGFLDDFNTAFNCNWNSRQPFDNNGCMGNKDPTNAGFASCQQAQNCLYPHFFDWINEAVRQAKQYSTRPFTATFADIDSIISDTPATDLIPRFGKYMPDVDIYGFQLYRGHSFGQYFEQYYAETSKPLIVAEYGLDAMNDPCGWPENYDTMQPCSVWTPGSNGQPGGSDVPPNAADFVGCIDKTLACSVPGVTAQAQWDTDLTREIMNSKALGGFLFEWVDEFWKNVETQDSCTTPCPYDDLAICSNPATDVGATYTLGGSAGCTYKAHLSCGNPDASVHDLCGYFLWGAPDNYVNEAWFGLNSVTDCNTFLDAGPAAHHHLTALTPRPIIDSLTTLWGGVAGPTPLGCNELKPCWSCTTSSTELDIRKGACDSVCNLNFAATYDDGTTNPPPPPPNSSTGSNQNPGDGGGNDGGGDVGGDGGNLNTDKGAAIGVIPSSFIVIMLALTAMWM